MSFSKKFTFYTLALLSVLPGVSLAASYDIGSMSITAGTFSITNPKSHNTDSGSFDSIGSNTNLVGGYIGSGGAGTDWLSQNSTFVVSGIYLSGFRFSLYTAAANLGDTPSQYIPGFTVPAAGTISGGPVPSGTIYSWSPILLDLRSMFVNIFDTDANVGTGKFDGVTSDFASGRWDPVTHVYNIAWTSLLTSPACNQCVANFTLTGIATPVPLPAAFWLFISGLGGLGGWMRAWRGFRK